MMSIVPRLSGIDSLRVSVYAPETCHPSGPPNNVVLPHHYFLFAPIIAPNLIRHANSRPPGQPHPAPIQRRSHTLAARIVVATWLQSLPPHPRGLLPSRHLRFLALPINFSGRAMANFNIMPLMLINTKHRHGNPRLILSI